MGSDHFIHPSKIFDVFIGDITNTGEGPRPSQPNRTRPRWSEAFWVAGLLDEASIAGQTQAGMLTTPGQTAWGGPGPSPGECSPTPPPREAPAALGGKPVLGQMAYSPGASNWPVHAPGCRLGGAVQPRPRHSTKANQRPIPPGPGAGLDRQCSEPPTSQRHRPRPNNSDTGRQTGSHFETIDD